MEPKEQSSGSEPAWPSVAGDVVQSAIVPDQNRERIIFAIIAIFVFGGLVFALWPVTTPSDMAREDRKQPVAPIEEVNTREVEQQGSSLSPIVVPPSVTVTSATPTTPPAVKKTSTCGERTTPSSVAYGKNDPRDYLAPFVDAFQVGVLTDKEKETIKCFFENANSYTPGNASFVFNLDKNFSSFVLSVANWTPDGKVGMQISDPEFTSGIAYFYTRKVGEQWKIIDITDPAGLLK